jgi:class 3 adenylate cyclase
MAALAMSFALRCVGGSIMPVAVEIDQTVRVVKKSETGILYLLRSLTLRSKLLLMLLPTSLLSMGTVALLSYQSGKRALTAQATDHVLSVRASKKQQIENHFRTLRDTFGVFGDDVAVVSATSLFKDGFSQLGRVRLSEDRRRKLEDYYRSSYLPTLTKRSPKDPILFENVFPRNDKAIEAQALFIAENPRTPDRSQLVDHPVSNPYTLAHFTYHPWFREVAQKLKLYDLMLVDADSGAMVYSVLKEPDFGTSLVDGAYANSNIGRLFRQVLAEHKKGLVRLSDLENYTASNFDPSMFIATPVYANFKLIGVMIGQLSVEEISRTMNGDKSWAQDGLGKTGNAFVVGPNLLLRSEHRSLVENKDVFFSQLRENGLPETTISDIREANTGILRLPMNVEGVRRAMRGETGTVVATNTKGIPSLQAYTPLQIPDLNWSLVAQIDEHEILAPQLEFQRNLMILACALALATTLAAMGLASRFLRPVNDLLTGLARIQDGALDVKLLKQSDDEFGRLTEGVRAMHQTLVQKDGVIAEKSHANEALLKQIFPPSVAERLKRGETQIYDRVANVTVIYATIIGFVRETEAMDGAQSMALLAEVFDTMDALAVEHGVERIKTFGEQYLAVCGLTVPRLDHAQRSVAFCDALSLEIGRIARERAIHLQFRSALASGEINAGIIGANRYSFDIWGRPLSFARRLIHDTGTEELRISIDTHALLGGSGGFVEKPVVQGLTLGPMRSYGRSLGVAPAKIVSPLSQAAE